jgi:hypothetical protein
MPTATDLVTDLPADFEVFGQAVATSMADLLGGTSGQILAKNSNTDMDFVWIANDQGDITAVTAGTGISGGGTSGAVTITNSMATEIAAKGDLIVGTGSATFDNLGVGTNGQVLTADSTVSPTGLKWATPASGASFVGASASARASQSIANNTPTAIALNTQQFSTNSIHSTTVNNSRFTIPTGYGGKWLFTAVSGFDPLTAGNMILRFYVNGSSIGLAIFTGNTNAGTLTSTSITNVLNLVAGDYVQLFIYQNSGVAATTMVSGAEDFTFMNCSFIGA